MRVRPVQFLRDLRRVEKAFALALVICIALRLAAPGSGAAALFTLIAYLLGIVTVLRLARTGVQNMIWRLRNRLIVAYLFIAVVPVGLILILFGISGYWLTVQIAGYLINAELARRTNMLRRPAEMLTRMPAANRAEYTRRMAPLLGGMFPELAIVVSGPQPFKLPSETELDPPPSGWGEAHGVVVRDGRMYSWAHAVAPDGADITILAPLTRDYMAGLVPGIGLVDLVRGSLEPPRRGGVNVRIGEKYYQGEPARGPRRDRIPPPYITGDIGISGADVPGSCSAVLARRDLVVQVGAFDETLHGAEDPDLWIRLAAVCGYACLPEPGVVVLRRSGSVSRNLQAMRDSTLRMLRKNRQLLPAEFRGGYWRRCVAGVHGDYAKWRYRKGQRTAALHELACMMVLSPLGRGRLGLGLLRDIVLS